MALSNIFREPRREITETVVGVVIAVGFLFLDWRFGLWFREKVGARDVDQRGLFIGLLIGAVGIPILLLMFQFIHFIGEEVCDWLQDKGLRLRPKQRYD